MNLDTLIYSNLSPEQLAGGFGLISFFGGALGALFVAGIIVAILSVIGLYLYTALCYMALSRKLGYKKGRWLAWIPIINMFLIPILAKKYWAWGFILLVPIANIVFFVLWHWKIFERVGRPGWWTLLVFLPKVGFIVFLVMLGIAAFGKKR